jgi:hypothetical protein
MFTEWSRSQSNVARNCAFFIVVTFHSIDLFGQVAAPQQPRLVKTAVSGPDARSVAHSDEDAPASNHRNSIWDNEAEEQEADRVVAAPDARNQLTQLPISIESSVFGADDVGGHHRLKRLLYDKLDQIKLEYPDLNNLAIERLKLAGWGDITRFQDQVAALSFKHQGTGWNTPGFRELFAELRNLNSRLESPLFFGNQSLLTKTLRTIVTKEHLTAQQIPGTSPALALPDIPPPVNRGIALRQIRLAEGRSIMMVEFRQLPQVVRPILKPLPQVPAQAIAGRALEIKYYQRLAQLIVDSLEPDASITLDQWDPLTAVLRMNLKPAFQIPFNNVDEALWHLSQVPEKAYMDVLDAKQWTVLKRRFEAAKAEHEKKDREP